MIDGLENKRVFLLEDDAMRIHWFKRVIGSRCIKLDIASEVEAGKRYLRETQYDLIFLDHDLEPQHYELGAMGYTEACYGTGYDLATWLAGPQDGVIQYQQGALIVLHSLNPDGVRRMAEALAAWKPIVIPFTHLYAMRGV